ncbi:cadherin-related family member 3-like isoform X2 [Carcharodon carcharias]|uniref:cadherin-related family member 3-like isoform X2 n=1 Tax=Carcharodon carcharias TaxID=13397 RepID=UPI001B7ED618|nr:cadherin-related family member 3-like isoform X2 [Carcharodon carcharias]
MHCSTSRITLKKMWKTLSVFFLFESLSGIHSAPTISGVNPLNIGLQEDAVIHHLLTTITVAVPAGDKLVGAPVIINADPAKYPFQIIPNVTNKWDLVTTSSPKLDFESIPRYTLQLLVTDEKGSSASQTIIIKILDVNEPPIFLGTLAKQGAEVYIAENTAVNTVIYKVAAKDPDKNDVLKYSLSGTTDFQIDATGSIYVANTLDYENATKSYSLSVKVEDANGLFITGVVKVFIINVNDNSPVLSCIFKNRTNGTETDVVEKSDSGKTAIISLDEELAVGTIAAICTATDADVMGDITYQLDPASHYFAIDKDTGKVMVFSWMNRDLNGFQQVQTFSVKACDENLKCADIPVRANIIPLNDNAPFCNPSVYRATFPELLLHDTVVATLICMDADVPGDTLTYVPESGPLGPGMTFEQKAGAANIIQVGTKDLDYEDVEVAAMGYTYKMTIAVSDSTIPTHTATATVIIGITPVNDFSPKFEKDPYIFDVLETEAAKHKIGKVIATDDDFPLNAVTYKIISGDSQVIKRFWIDPEEGTIELITQPDYESVHRYNLSVEAIDSDPNQPRTAVTTVIINIIEENDEKPVCVPRTYKATILDNIAVGTNINSFRLSCQDRDSLNNEMRFEIVSGNVNNHFGFDPIRGSHAPKLIIRAPFDFEGKEDIQQQYHLIVNIIDDNIRKDKPRTGTVVIDITVIQTRTTPPTTTSFYKRKGLTVINTAVNIYNQADWYVPFIVTLLAILLALLFALGLFIILKYTKCVEVCRKAWTRKPKPQPPKKVKIHLPEPKKEKIEVVTEVTKYDTVFNGQAIDPVTGRWYEYNSATGARKWKEANESNGNIAPEKAKPEIPQAPKEDELFQGIKKENFK